MKPKRKPLDSWKEQKGIVFASKAEVFNAWAMGVGFKNDEFCYTSSWGSKGTFVDTTGAKLRIYYVGKCKDHGPACKAEVFVGAS